MRDRDRLDYVIGQLAALKTFCFAVVASHPDWQTLGVCITAMSEQTLADLLVTPASDKWSPRSKICSPILLKRFACNLTRAVTSELPIFRAIVVLMAGGTGAPLGSTQPVQVSRICNHWNNLTRHGCCQALFLIPQRPHRW